MSNLEEAKVQVIQRLIKFGGKASRAQLGGIPYGKIAIRELIQEKCISRNQQGIRLHPSYKPKGVPQELLQQLEEQKEQARKAQEQKRIHKEQTLQVFQQLLDEHDEWVSSAQLAQCEFSQEQLKWVKKAFLSMTAASKVLSKEEATWFYTGPKEIAQKKLRKVVKQKTFAHWEAFMSDFCEALQVELTFPDGKAKSATAIKKATEKHAVSIGRMSKESGIPRSVLERAFPDLRQKRKKKEKTWSIVNPEGTTLYSLAFVKRRRKNIEGYYTVTTSHMAVALGISQSKARRILKKEGIEPYSTPGQGSYTYLWKDVVSLFPEGSSPVEILGGYKKDRSDWLEKQREQEREREKREQERLQKLKDQLLAMFPIKAREGLIPKVFFHIGPTNSGKTYRALKALKEAKSGIYLGPLRLLAWEVFEKLNDQGYPCELITGEEVVSTPNARYCAATVEIYDRRWFDVIVLDEAQMATDPQRGGAWTRVLAHARAKEIHICCSPEAEGLLHAFLKKLGYTDLHTHHYERLSPLGISDKPVGIQSPEPGTVYVVFSRRLALALKSHFEEKLGLATSIIYGGLPPDVRKQQAQRFLSGETKVCVATDAIGMGLNLPARQVSFTTLKKFDGTQVRTLTPMETRQIAGRAGRFGLQEKGWVSACKRQDLDQLRHLLKKKGKFPLRVRLSPTLLELDILSGSLHQRLVTWQEMAAIPKAYLRYIEPASLQDMLELAQALPASIRQKLGLQNSFTLIQAPVHESSQHYWLLCAHNIAEGQPLPLPLLPPVQDPPESWQLDALEAAVRQAELYLWLGHRQSFQQHTSQEQMQWLMEEKRTCSLGIDKILQKAALARHRLCRDCTKELSPIHPHALCNACYERRKRERRMRRWDDEYDDNSY